MDIDNIVNRIVEEVLKRSIDLDSKEANLVIDEEVNKGHRDCKISLLITERPNSNRFNEISSKIDGDKYLVYSLKDYWDGKKDYSIVIIGSLLNGDLANLALGVQWGVIEKIAIQGLFSGERVILLEDGIEYRNYKNTVNENLYVLYQNHEKNLLSFGIELVSLVDLKGVLPDNSSKPLEKGVENFIKCDCGLLMDKSITFEDFTDRKVITESEIKRLLGKSKKTIRVNNKVIITPLCRDFLKKHNIVVEVM